MCDFGSLRVRCEVSAHVFADEERFLGEAQSLAGFGCKLGAPFTVSSGGACDFGNAFTDNRFGDHDLGLAVVVALGVGDGFRHSLDVVSVNGDGIPPL